MRSFVSVPYRQQAGGGIMSSLKKIIGKSSRFTRKAGKSVARATRKAGRSTRGAAGRASSKIKRTTKRVGVRAGRVGKRSKAFASRAAQKVAANRMTGKLVNGFNGKSLRNTDYRRNFRRVRTGLKTAKNLAEVGYNGYQLYNMATGRPYESDGLKGAVIRAAARKTGLNLADYEMGGEAPPPSVAAASEPPPRLGSARNLSSVGAWQRSMLRHQQEVAARQARQGGDFNSARGASRGYRTSFEDRAWGTGYGKKKKKKGGVRTKKKKGGTKKKKKKKGAKGRRAPGTIGLRPMNIAAGRAAKKAKYRDLFSPM